MNILFIGPYHQIDKLGQYAYNYLGMLNSIPNINLVARPFQYNSLLRKIDKWCLILENKECCSKYDYIFQCCMPHDFVYTPNSVCTTIIDSMQINNKFLLRKISLPPKITVSSLREKEIVKNDKNISVVPLRIDTELKYNSFNPPQIDDLGKSYIFYWVGEYSDEYCYKEVLRAYHLEFDRKENVNLVMYFIAPQTHENIKLIGDGLQKIKFGINKHKNIDYYKNETIIVGGDIDTIRSYHAHLDCYIDINRGANNWSLVKEAHLFGKKTIINYAPKHNIKEAIINHPYYSSQNYWKYICVEDIRLSMRSAFQNKTNDVIDNDKLDYKRGGKDIIGVLGI